MLNEGKAAGIVSVLEETKTFGAKGFRKRVIVLEQDQGRFTNYIPLEATRDGCDELDEVQVGDEVEVKFRMSGRKWQKDERSEVRYFGNAELVSFRVLRPADDGGVQSVSHAGEPDQFADDEEAPF